MALGAVLIYAHNAQQREVLESGVDEKPAERMSTPRSDRLPRDAQPASVLLFLTVTIRVVWPNQPATVDLLRRLMGIFRPLDSRQYH